MLKKNLALCIALTLLLSGCGGVKQNENNMNAIDSQNKNIINSQTNESSGENKRILMNWIVLYFNISEQICEHSLQIFDCIILVLSSI